MSLEGRVALVTGGNRGIGSAICLALAAEGAAVGVHFHTDRERATKVVKAIQDNGGTASAFQADVGSRVSVDQMIGQCRSGLGPVDILVNNARQLVPGREFLDLDWETDYLPHIEVMLKGAFQTCQAVLPSMIERRWGRIVNLLTTVLGERSVRTNSYGTVKSALLYFSQNLATEMGPHGITVNMVSPGLTSTERPLLHSAGYTEEYIRRTPAGRLGTPEDAASAVAYLAGEKAEFVTGVNLSVSGGKVMF